MGILIDGINVFNNEYYDVNNEFDCGASSSCGVQTTHPTPAPTFYFNNTNIGLNQKFILWGVFDVICNVFGNTFDIIWHEIGVACNVNNEMNYFNKLEIAKKYVTRFQDSEENKENKVTGDDDDGNKRGPTKQFDTVVLKANGKAINKAEVTTAEVVKRAIADLHQETTFETLEIVDAFKLLCKIEDVAGYQKPIAQETGFNLGYHGNARGGGDGRNRNGHCGNNRRYQRDR